MMQFGNLTLKQCKYGWMLFYGPYIGKCFDLYGQYSESEVALMRRYLREGSTSYNGARNPGYASFTLALGSGTGLATTRMKSASGASSQVSWNVTQFQ